MYGLACECCGPETVTVKIVDGNDAEYDLIFRNAEMIGFKRGHSAGMRAGLFVGMFVTLVSLALWAWIVWLVSLI
jgi:hypothetical protein